jgi:uncharacterized membrane protein
MAEPIPGLGIAVPVFMPVLANVEFDGAGMIR